MPLLLQVEVVQLAVNSLEKSLLLCIIQLLSDALRPLVLGFTLGVVGDERGWKLLLSDVVVGEKVSGLALRKGHEEPLVDALLHGPTNVSIC